MKKWLLICSCLIFATVLSACSSADAPVEPLLESTSRFTLTLLVSGEGSVTATTDSGIFGGTRTTTYRVSSRPYRISLPKGTRVSLRGNADSVSWGGPKIPSLPCLSSLRTCNFTLTQSVTQHVSLSKAKSNKLEVEAVGNPNGRITGAGIDCGGGATRCTSTVKEGSTVTLYASGADVAIWIGKCDRNPTRNSCQFTMRRGHFMRVAFDF